MFSAVKDIFTGNPNGQQQVSLEAERSKYRHRPPSQDHLLDHIPSDYHYEVKESVRKEFYRRKATMLQSGTFYLPFLVSDQELNILHDVYHPMLFDVCTDLTGKEATAFNSLANLQPHVVAKVGQLLGKEYLETNAPNALTIGPDFKEKYQFRQDGSFSEGEAIVTKLDGRDTSRVTSGISKTGRAGVRIAKGTNPNIVTPMHGIHDNLHRAQVLAFNQVYDMSPTDLADYMIKTGAHSAHGVMFAPTSLFFEEEHEIGPEGSGIFLKFQGDEVTMYFEGGSGFAYTHNKYTWGSWLLTTVVNRGSYAFSLEIKKRHGPLICIEMCRVLKEQRFDYVPENLCKDFMILPDLIAQPWIVEACRSMSAKAIKPLIHKWLYIHNDFYHDVVAFGTTRSFDAYKQHHLGSYMRAKSFTVRVGGKVIQLGHNMQDLHAKFTTINVLTNMLRTIETKSTGVYITNIKEDKDLNLVHRWFLSAKHAVFGFNTDVNPSFKSIQMQTLFALLTCRNNESTIIKGYAKPKEFTHKEAFPQAYYIPSEDGTCLGEAISRVLHGHDAHKITYHTRFKGDLNEALNTLPVLSEHLDIEEGHVNLRAHPSRCAHGNGYLQNDTLSPRIPIVPGHLKAIHNVATCLTKPDHPQSRKVKAFMKIYEEVSPRCQSHLWKMVRVLDDPSEASKVLLCCRVANACMTLVQLVRSCNNAYLRTNRYYDFQLFLEKQLRIMKLPFVTALRAFFKLPISTLLGAMRVISCSHKRRAFSLCILGLLSVFLTYTPTKYYVQAWRKGLRLVLDLKHPKESLFAACTARGADVIHLLNSGLFDRITSNDIRSDVDNDSWPVLSTRTIEGANILCDNCVEREIVAGKFGVVYADLGSPLTIRGEDQMNTIAYSFSKAVATLEKHDLKFCVKLQNFTGALVNGDHFSKWLSEKDYFFYPNMDAPTEWFVTNLKKGNLDSALQMFFNDHELSQGRRPWTYDDIKANHDEGAFLMIYTKLSFSFNGVVQDYDIPVVMHKSCKAARCRITTVSAFQGCCEMEHHMTPTSESYRVVANVTRHLYMDRDEGLESRVRGEGFELDQHVHELVCDYGHRSTGICRWYRISNECIFNRCTFAFREEEGEDYSDDTTVQMDDSVNDDSNASDTEELFNEEWNFRGKETQAPVPEPTKQGEKYVEAEVHPTPTNNGTQATNVDTPKEEAGDARQPPRGDPEPQPSTSSAEEQSTASWADTVKAETTLDKPKPKSTLKTKLGGFWMLKPKTQCLAREVFKENLRHVEKATFTIIEEGKEELVAIEADKDEFNKQTFEQAEPVPDYVESTEEFQEAREKKPFVPAPEASDQPGAPGADLFSWAVANAVFIERARVAVRGGKITVGLQKEHKKASERYNKFARKYGGSSAALIAVGGKDFQDKEEFVAIVREHQKIYDEVMLTKRTSTKSRQKDRKTVKQEPITFLSLQKRKEVAASLKCSVKLHPHKPSGTRRVSEHFAQPMAFIKMLNHILTDDDITPTLKPMFDGEAEANLVMKASEKLGFGFYNVEGGNQVGSTSERVCYAYDKEGWRYYYMIDEGTTRGGFFSVTATNNGRRNEEFLEGKTVPPGACKPCDFQMSYTEEDTDSPIGTSKVRVSQGMYQEVFDDFKKSSMNTVDKYKELNENVLKALNRIEKKDLDTEISGWTGVAGSGKTTRVLSEFDKAVITFITPTSRHAQDMSSRAVTAYSYATGLLNVLSSARYKDPDQVIVLDEVFLMDPMVLLAICAAKTNGMISAKIVVIGDEEQNTYGSKERPAKFTYDQFFDTSSLGRLNISFSVPQDICYWLRLNKTLHLSYRIMTRSKVVNSIYYGGLLPPGDKEYLCFTSRIRDAAEKRSGTAKTAVQAQGMRQEVVHLYIDSEAIVLMRGIPSQVRVALTRHTKKLYLYGSSKSFLEKVLGIEFGEAKHTCGTQLVGGKIFRDAKGFIHDYTGTEFHNDPTRTITDKQLSAAKAKTNLSRPYSAVAAQNCVVEDQIVESVANVGLPVETQTSVEAFGRPLIDVRLCMEPVFKTPKLVDFGDVGAHTAGIEGMEEMLRDVAPSTQPIDRPLNRHIHLDMPACNQMLTIKPDAMLVDDNPRPTRHLAGPCRGRPTFADDANQALFTVIKRGNRQDLGAREGEMLLSLKGAFHRYVKECRPPTVEDISLCFAEQMREISKKRNSAGLNPFENVPADYGIKGFLKEQTKADLNPEAWLRIDKAGQFINAQSKSVNLIIGATVRALEKALEASIDPRIAFAFNRNPEQLNDFVKTKLRWYTWTQMSSDFKECDQLHAWASRRFFLWILEQFEMDTVWTELSLLLSVQWQTDAGLIRRVMKECLQSGAAYTLLKNTVYALFLMLAYLDIRNLLMIICQGDDVCVIAEFIRACVPEWLQCSIKVEEGRIPSVVGYLIGEEVTVDLYRIAARIVNKNFNFSNTNQAREKIREYQTSVMDRLCLVNTWQRRQHCIVVNAEYHKCSEFSVDYCYDAIHRFATASYEEIRDALIPSLQYALHIRSAPKVGSDIEANVPRPAGIVSWANL